jgi:hypothetical protein
MLDEDFLAYPTVARFSKEMDDMSPLDRKKRLDTIKGFCDFVGEDPDHMIATVFDEETRKYKRRGFFSEKAKEYAATFGDSPNAQLQRSNIVRGFFIANGRRLLAEQPEWMKATINPDDGE